MPESPEVQSLAETLDRRVTGCRIHGVDLVEFRAMKTRGRPLASLVGASIAGVHRIGKYLDIALESGHVVISLGRHGWVRWTDAAGVAADGGVAPALVVLTFDCGTLELTDAGSWVSVGVWLTDRPDAVPAIGKLGPDPLDPDFSRDIVDRAVAGRRKQLKAILQEQESFAGIGNAYSDEILHRARLSPLVHGDLLTDGERARLFAAMRDVLGAATRARRGIPIETLKQAKIDAMVVHGRGGQACPACGGVIHDLAFGGTTAQYCPSCQTPGVVVT
ncbi:Fpg/Nei family DNA glycosylase [Microbacterium kribbense]|uniref:Fpg/Nei family DNA glycosylase n=1 Tax=Microbacterium kribbense TaxID=433645 RepID=A0ABP7GBK7_9MICO